MNLSNGNTTAAAPAEQQLASQRWQAFIEWGLVFLVFTWHAAWPVPDTNEPDYVGKAFHYWNPHWGAGDLFLESANPHLLFYLTFGPITQWLSLEVATWTGRLVTWGLLAAGWLYLSRGFLQVRWWSVLSAALFVTLTVRMHLAGEWVVGGCEPKGFAYALLLFALGHLVRNRWNVALVLLGAAAAFHVLVGGWCVIAMGWAWLWAGSQRPGVKQLLPGLAIGGLLSLVGIIPAIAMNSGLDADLRQQSNIIYVYYRLSHHLVPSAFGWWFWTRAIALVLIWLVLTRMIRPGTGQHWLRGVVTGSIIIAAVGVLLTFITPVGSALQASLLRWYWFRLADALVPLGVALLATQTAAVLGERRRAWGRGFSAVLVVLCGLHLGDYAPYRFQGTPPRADSPGRIIDYADWLDICQWVSANTADNALFITPRLNQTFKWRTGRAEVATWKDLPQDTAAIVQWWQRLLQLHTEYTTTGQLVWRSRMSSLPAEELLPLAEQWEADYLIAFRLTPLELPLEYQNNTYAIYRLPASAEDAITEQ